MTNDTLTLAHRTIAIPETRQLDVMANMLEKRGASVVRCPLISIYDAPDPQPVEGWLRDFIETPPAIFIILTGEGLRRLSGFAERAGLKDDFIAALSQVHTLIRGPKPGRALKEIGLVASQTAQAPTTDGVIATLESESLAGKRVAVQLYGTEPNRKLMDFLSEQHAIGLAVAPYIYASEADEDRVLQLISGMQQGRIDVMTFTAQAQFKRLLKVARKHDLEASLRQGLEGVIVAAIGPVMRGLLEQENVRVDVSPESSYFMKPMVKALEKCLQHR